MLQARVRPAGADRRVERVVAAHRAEGLAVAAAETRDRRLVQDHLADRPEREALGLAYGALAQRVEAAQGLELVAEEVQAQRLGLARRVDVDDAAAQRVLARLAHGLRALVAVGREEGHQVPRVQPVARPAGQHPPLERRARRQALQQRAHRGDDEAPAGRWRGVHQAGETGDAPGDDVAVRADPVVGQAVPGRQGQDLGLRREEPDRLGQARHARVVPRHMEQRPGLAGRPARREASRQHQGVHALRRVGEQHAARFRQPFCERFQRCYGFNLNCRNKRVTSWSCSAGGALLPVSQS